MPANLPRHRERLRRRRDPDHRRRRLLLHRRRLVRLRDLGRLHERRLALLPDLPPVLHIVDHRLIHPARQQRIVHGDRLVERRRQQRGLELARFCQRKLEAAQQNLTRIDDIVFEVDKQRGTLKRQAAKARRYKRLREELRRWEKVLFARRYRELAHAIEAALARLASAREREGAAAARVERIYNGLDLEQFHFQPPIARRPKIVAVGRLIEKKGFQYLIAACDILKSRGLRFSCTIVGAGPLEPELRAQITRLGLSAEILLPGPRPQREVIELVQEAAVLAAPCVVGADGNRDGLPTVLVEAMALGTPCVSTDVTGIPEILHDRRTGLLVTQRDTIALASALEQLLTEHPFALSVATGARQLIETEFDIDTNSAMLRELFGRCGRTFAFQEVA